MNRQVVAFLSLFSLVLVLSIYYVMLPVGVKKSATGDDTSLVGNIVNNAADPYIESIVLSRTTDHTDAINVQLEIMGSSDYTAAQKVIASEEIAHIESVMKMEKDIRVSIKDAGYPSSYVEVADAVVNVLAVSTSKTALDVVTIMECVDSYYYPVVTQVIVMFR